MAAGVSPPDVAKSRSVIWDLSPMVGAVGTNAGDTASCTSRGKRGRRIQPKQLS